MAALAIHKLRTKVRMGCKSEERAYPRLIEIDVRMHYDMRKAIAADSIELGVDYNQVAQAIERMSGSREWKLIETFAADAAREVLGLNPRIDEVVISARRDVMAMASTIEVTLRLNREGLID